MVLDSRPMASRRGRGAPLLDGVKDIRFGRIFSSRRMPCQATGFLLQQWSLIRVRSEPFGSVGYKLGYSFLWSCSVLTRSFIVFYYISQRSVRAYKKCLYFSFLMWNGTQVFWFFYKEVCFVLFIFVVSFFPLISFTDTAHTSVRVLLSSLWPHVGH